MKRVLILDANQRSALAATRSLGRRGVAVYTSDSLPMALAGASRYSRAYLHTPDPKTRSRDFIACIDDFCRQNHIEMLLPMTELCTELLLGDDAIAQRYILPFADAGRIDALADKCALMQLAHKLDIPAPASRFYAAGERPDDLHALHYPIVLKPGKSWLFGQGANQGQWYRASVRIARDASELQGFLEHDPAFSHAGYMLQQCITGQGAGVFALYDHGREVAVFSHRRLREKPPSGGVSVYSESAAIEPQQLAISRKLLRAVDWHGVAMVEFKVDAGGTPWLMEVNTRLWGSLQLAIDAGVDFPWLLYRIACGEELAPVSQYHHGNRLRWLLGDVDHLYLVLRDRRIPASGKLAAIGRFLRPHWQSRHEVNRLGDLRPAWFELKTWLKDLAGR